MRSEMIWEQINQEKAAVLQLISAQSQKEVAQVMGYLKQKIDCLFGYDDKADALVFKSEDDGLVAVRMIYDAPTKTLALALEADIQLEEIGSPNEIDPSEQFGNFQQPW